MKFLGRCIGLVLLLALSRTQAGTMVVGRSTYEGTLEGYADGRFVFRTTQGEVLRQARSGVVKVLPGDDCKVTFEQVGRKPETARLVKYEKMRFTFEKDGKQRAVFANAVKSMTVTAAAPAGGGPGGERGPQGFIPAVDTRGIEGTEMTPGQASALQRYKKARATYERFLAESTEKVAEMESATGRKRSDLLTRLRMRKTEERPVLDELKRTTDALYKAFPPPGE